ncbi:MAG: LuxR C-terminal-related transcriptional regulator [Hafnia sp.]
MINSPVRLRGINGFACLGVATLLNEMAGALPPDCPPSLSIVVLSRTALSEVMQYCQRLDPEYDYIVVGDEQSRTLLAGNTTLKVMAVIDIGLPVPHLRYALYQALTSARAEVEVKIAPVFTLRERAVLNYLKRGMNTVQIAFLMGLNAKTISTYKRSAMKKLRVPNNQALYCQLAAMRSQDEHTDDTRGVARPDMYSLRYTINVR